MAGQSDEDMGEQAVTPNNAAPTEEAENVSEEYNQLDSKLDELNTALDFLEQKNDTIHSQLLQLLHSNREIRQELQQENASTGADVPCSSSEERDKNDN